MTDLLARLDVLGRRTGFDATLRHTFRDAAAEVRALSGRLDAAHTVICHLLAGDEPPNPRHHWWDTDTPVTPAETAEIRAATAGRHT